jgi:hypothetical protein
MRIGWLYMRAVRRLGLDRNPLRRSSDRIEAGLLCGMIVAFAVLAPLTAVKASQWVTATGAREVRTEQTTQSPTAPSMPSRVTPYKAAGYVSMPEGALIPVRVPTKGTPLTMAQVRSRAQLAVVVAPVALALVMALVFWIIRRMLDRRRMAAWGLAWSVIGPQWSRRR